MSDKEFAIRIAAPADEVAIGALLARSYQTRMAPHYAPDVIESALPLMTKANPALLRSQTYYVAQTRGGALIGCGGWSIEEPGTGAIVSGVARMRHFATDPALTRRGIGRAIIERCIEQAEIRGVTRLTCFAALGSEDFYASCGFIHARRQCPWRCRASFAFRPY